MSSPRSLTTVAILLLVALVALMLAAGALAGATLDRSAALAPLARPAPAAQVVLASADAAVRADRPSSRLGHQRHLLIRGRPAARAYLRFSLSRLPGRVGAASLSLRARSSSRAQLEVRPILGSWRERSVRWASAPRVGRVVARSRAFRGRTRVVVDVTGLVAGAGELSFALTTRGRAVAVDSRERRRTAPRLTVTFATQDSQPSFPIRAAFYYAWFPEAWTQSGLYPYTKFQPSQGFYDGSDPATVRGQLRALDYGGFDAAIASWWGRHSRTDRRMPTLLSTTREAGSRLRWAIYYEAEAEGRPSSAKIARDLAYIVGRYGRDPAYLRIDGRPVVFVYADRADRCGMVDRWKRGNTLGVYLVLKVFPRYRLCPHQPDSWHQYAPVSAADSQPGWSFTVSPGFDKATEPRPRLARDPARFRRDAAAMVASRAPWQLVTTFNEWGEGTAVESANDWRSASGYGVYLDILHGTGGPQPPTLIPAPTPGPSAGDPAIAAAGDIACDPADSNFNNGNGTAAACHMRATSDLLLGRDLAAVLALGDTQYDSGTLEAFRRSFDPTWGRVKALIRPAVGNHEYGTPGGAGYFDYFNGPGATGGPAGPRGQGYYSYDVGAWHVVALNSNCSQVGGCDFGSPQERWVRADLAAHPARCTLAYWHHPRFSSGEHGNSDTMAPIWQALQDAGADVVLSGHDHDYERFAPQTAWGAPDAVRGIREFVVGTGGRNHYSFATVRPNSEVRESRTYGVLTMVLHANGFDWAFVSEPGADFTDRGSADCH